MNRRLIGLFIGANFAALAPPACADAYLGVQGAYSSDADGTDIARTAVDFDFSHVDEDHYRGLSLEQARFRPAGRDRAEEHRVYFRFADSGERWKWNGRIGSDGHTLLGSASVHDESPRRQEYFIEREIVETPLGLRDRHYATYAGGAFDLPLGEGRVLSTVLGAQDFGGDNLRLHYRGNLVQVLDEGRGLSAQLRLRYFHDSHPGESDYYSPRWHAQALPTLQLRRHAKGWRYVLAAGYGLQSSAGESWKPARLVQASVTSPVLGQGWVMSTAFTYTNTPVGNGATYDYRQFMLTAGRSF